MLPYPYSFLFSGTNTSENTDIEYAIYMTKLNADSDQIKILSKYY